MVTYLLCIHYFSFLEKKMKQPIRLIYLLILSFLICQPIIGHSEDNDLDLEAETITGENLANDFKKLFEHSNLFIRESMGQIAKWINTNYDKSSANTLKKIKNFVKWTQQAYRELKEKAELRGPEYLQAIKDFSAKVIESFRNLIKSDETITEPILI